MVLGGDSETGDFFTSTAVGWLLRLLFFPSGILSLLLIGLILHRGNNKRVKGDDAGERDGKGGKEKMIFSALEKELERMCNGLAVGKQRQKDLELCGRIDSSSCGYCLGEGGDSFGYAQLPCGHFHHVQCVRRALRLRIFKCADCGDAIVNFDAIMWSMGRGATPHTV